MYTDEIRNIASVLLYLLMRNSMSEAHAIYPHTTHAQLLPVRLRMFHQGVKLFEQIELSKVKIKKYK